ncbi:hypothetical protein O6H91_23G049900 [Diphasiastrum complanatum]|uniref:Uncharacterized protein n=1 Tax=Diphasiastrum complanatum TaxID=34168 RepID=A0ACC2ABT5_DIPCM|nr:hypothetical protein O6H91_23G049900 [Diphasiastrum complanatum]
MRWTNSPHLISERSFIALNLSDKTLQILALGGCWLWRRARCPQLQVLELAELCGLHLREDVFVILWDLMQCNTPPMLVLELLRSLAGVTVDASPHSSTSTTTTSKLRDGVPSRTN